MAAGNKVSLVPYTAGKEIANHSVKHQLHLSHLRLPDHPRAAEVNTLFNIIDGGKTHINYIAISDDKYDDSVLGCTFFDEEMGLQIM